MKAHVPLAILSLGLAGCAATPDASKEPKPVAVSVSAANYSQLSNEDLYARVNAPANRHPQAPPPSVSMRPLYYLMVPGEVYATDVSMDVFYRELELALEPRRYFNVIYQMRAGHTPARIDYILRVHFGERKWLTPTVRSDRITWGNDGIVSNQYMTNLAGNGLFDPRVGLSMDEVAAVSDLISMPRVSPGYGGSGPGVKGAKSIDPSLLKPDEHDSRDFGMGDQLAQDYCLVVVEAFKLEDVKADNKKAPCIWATFAAMPVERGQAFSGALRTILSAAAPYFGTTTNGPQVYEVPIGKVIMGSPTEVSGPQKTNLDNPTIQFRPPP
jgi:hypothetical protein